MLKRIHGFLDYWYLLKTKPLVIHAETIYKNKVWEDIKLFCEKKKTSWYVLSPANYEYIKSHFGCELSLEEYSKILLDRYTWLKEHNQNIQSHVHLRYALMYDDVDEKAEQREKITNSVGWLRENGFEVSEISFGWWHSNEISEDICNELGLEIIGRMDYPMVHDYEIKYYLGGR